MKIDEYDTEAVKSFTETFLTSLDRFWRELDLTQKQVFQNQIFPSGVACKNKNIRTTSLSQPLKLIEVFKDKDFDLVIRPNDSLFERTLAFWDQLIQVYEE